MTLIASWVLLPAADGVVRGPQLLALVADLTVLVPGSRSISPLVLRSASAATVLKTVSGEIADTVLALSDAAKAVVRLVVPISVGRRFIQDRFGHLGNPTNSRSARLSTAASRWTSRSASALPLWGVESVVYERTLNSLS